MSHIRNCKTLLYHLGRIAVQNRQKRGSHDCPIYRPTADGYSTHGYLVPRKVVINLGPQRTAYGRPDVGRRRLVPIDGVPPHVFQRSPVVFQDAPATAMDMSVSSVHCPGARRSHPPPSISVTFPPCLAAIWRELMNSSGAPSASPTATPYRTPFTLSASIWSRPFSLTGLSPETQAAW